MVVGQSMSEASDEPDNFRCDWPRNFLFANGAEIIAKVRSPNPLDGDEYFVAGSGVVDDAWKIPIYRRAGYSTECFNSLPRPS